MKYWSLVSTAAAMTIALGCASSPSEDTYERTITTAARYQNQQNFELAEQYHRQALEEMRNHPGVTDDRLARQLSNLASAINLNGRPKEAQALLEEAVELLNKQLVPDPRSLGAVLSNLARAEELQGNLENAEAHYLRSLELEMTIPNMPPAFLGFSMAGLANIYARRNELEKADECHNKARELYAGTLGPNSVSWRRRESEYMALRNASVGSPSKGE